MKIVVGLVLLGVVVVAGMTKADPVADPVADPGHYVRRYTPGRVVTYEGEPEPFFAYALGKEPKRFRFNDGRRSHHLAKRSSEVMVLRDSQAENQYDAPTRVKKAAFIPVTSQIVPVQNAPFSRVNPRSRPPPRTSYVPMHFQNRRVLSIPQQMRSFPLMGPQHRHLPTAHYQTYEMSPLSLDTRGNPNEIDPCFNPCIPPPQEFPRTVPIEQRPECDNPCMPLSGKYSVLAPTPPLDQKPVYTLSYAQPKFTFISPAQTMEYYIPDPEELNQETPKRKARPQCVRNTVKDPMKTPAMNQKAVMTYGPLRGGIYCRGNSGQRQQQYYNSDGPYQEEYLVE